MNENANHTFNPDELAASLSPLGIREITERMEVAPLLVDQGDLTAGQDATICCTCKIPWEELDESGMLSFAEVEPPMGAGMTGPIWPY
jgi:hypothetical protein